MPRVMFLAVQRDGCRESSSRSHEPLTEWGWRVRTFRRPDSMTATRLKAIKEAVKFLR